ncbi:MAG TPA: ABC transporter substrate-binding protein, partial [Thiotrichaceae bacterium]|nr:ABC transporter substrate-binding protein [Thiotrichaceae bacterium]
MKILTKTTLMTAILAASMSTLAQAKDVELVVVSWGGAYTKSQQKAYSEPFMKANPDIK